MSRIKVLLNPHLSLLSTFSSPGNHTKLQRQLNAEFCLTLSWFVHSLVFFFPIFDMLQCSQVKEWAVFFRKTKFLGQAVVFVYSVIVGGLQFAGVLETGRELHYGRSFPLLWRL